VLFHRPIHSTITPFYNPPLSAGAGAIVLNVLDFDAGQFAVGLEGAFQIAIDEQLVESLGVG
jgi:hypothetical protein